MSFTAFIKVLAFIVAVSFITYGLYLLSNVSQNQNEPSTEESDLIGEEKGSEENKRLEVEDIRSKVHDEFVRSLEEPSFEINSSEIQSRETEGYLTRSPSCSILDVDPWHESIVDAMVPVHLPKCSNLPPLTAIEEDSLIVIQERKKLYSFNERVTCCYKKITKKYTRTHNYKKQDDMYHLSSECFLIPEKVKLTPEDEFVLVNCYTRTKHVYSNVHARVPIRDNVRRKIKKFSNNHQKNLSVLVFIIDSFSRLNFIRRMPKSMDLFGKMGWVELRAYNEWDMKSFPSIGKLLTGLSVDKFKEVCEYPEKLSEKCPLIWKDFSRYGFVTCYGEDGNNLGKEFNKPLSGFAEEPTDYYLRHFFLAADYNIKDTYNYGGKTICLGPSLQVDLVYKYAAEFSKTFRNNLFFGIFKVNTLSFFNLKTQKSLDELTIDLLTKLSKDQIFNNTLVVFKSNHGLRHQLLSKHHIGWLEERLPFSFVWVPESYRKLYPEKYSNLVFNRGKLVSQFDLFLTLQEVLTGGAQKGTVSCPQCLSLFQELPWNRSCESAGISKEACACSRYSPVNINGRYSQQMVNMAVDMINRSLRNTDKLTRDGATCAILSAKRILSAWSQAEKDNKYTITFETEPSQAVFQAEFKVGWEEIKLVGSINRINLNAEQSKCMTHSILKRFCFCIYEK